MRKLLPLGHLPLLSGLACNKYIYEPLSFWTIEMNMIIIIHT